MIFRLRVPEQRADAGEQFLHRKRFWQVVIGPEVQPGDAIIGLPARGADEHRRRAAARAELAEHAEPVAARKIQVEHDGVVALAEAEDERLFTIVDLLHHVPFLEEGAAKIRGHLFFIFDDEQTHRFLGGIRVADGDVAAERRGYFFAERKVSMRRPFRQTRTVLPSWPTTPMGRGRWKPSAEMMSTRITAIAKPRF